MNYEFDITLKFNQHIEAKTEDEAVEQLKETFKDEYNIVPTDKEIKLILNYNYDR